MPSAATLKKLEVKKQYLQENREKIEQILKSSTIPEEVNLNELSLQEIREFNEKQSDPITTLNIYRNRSMQILHTNFLAEFIDPVTFNKDAKKSSPLYGIPISVKEVFAIEGLDSTLGLAKKCQNPKEFTSNIIKVLHHVGAIPFMTTSAAQGGLSIDSSNPIFGTQENPRFKGFLAGGSSGGEGIAISLGASPIGLGSDIGGSIRFPAAFNGICGLKPTTNRLSNFGHFELSDHLPIQFRVVNGPLGRRVEDLVDFFRAVLCDYHFNLDPTVVPIKFNEDFYSKNEKKLRVGFYTGFNKENFPATVPSVVRVIEQAAEIMQELGHEVKPFEIPDLNEALHLAVECLFADGGQALKDAYKNEVIDESNLETSNLLLIPRFLRKLFGGFFLRSYGSFIANFSKDLCGVDSYIQGSQIQKRTVDYRMKFLNHMQEFDIILCPLFTVPVPKKGTKSVINNMSCSYSFLYNMLDLPAGVLPLDSSTEEENKQALRIADNFKRLGDKMNYENFSSQTMEGQPLYVQVVGKPYREELVLYAMKELENRSNFKLKMPF